MVVEVSPEDVLALMPHQALTRIDGEPTHRALKKAEKELSSNLLAVDSPQVWGQGKGYLGIIQNAAIFVARNGAAFDPPNVAPPRSTSSITPSPHPPSLRPTGSSKPPTI